MEAKGTAVAAIPEFVKRKYPEKYDRWVTGLPEASRKIMEGKVLVSNWYPLEDAMIHPTKQICDMFYGGRPKGAWEAGQFSAENALKGIYKVFVRAGTPQFIIKRASHIFGSYFRPSKIEVVEAGATQIKVHITEFPLPNTLIEHRIGGWMEKALEISGCNLKTAKITRSLTRNDKVTEFVFQWQ